MHTFLTLGAAGLSPKRNVGATKELVVSASIVFGCSGAAADGAAGCDAAAGTPNVNAGAAAAGAAALSPPGKHH